MIDRHVLSLSRIRLLGIAGVFGLAVLLSGCATYHSLPLPRSSNLASSVADLVTDLPANVPTEAPQKIAVGKPLGINEIGLLAILNDPELKSERGEIGVAQAGLLQASLLPNPSVALSYAALLGGPGTVPAYTASLSQDVAAIVTYRARLASARARLSQVNADLLWREWQVAQKARLLALGIYWTDQSIHLNKRELALVSEELTQVQAATAAGNLDLTALSPLLAAKAAAEQSLASRNLDRLKTWQALNAILGLVPSARFAIAPPRLPPLPSDVDPLIRTLAERRPDLVALQLGYRTSDENVRATILGQFPAFILGGAWSSDTTNVKSAGPNVTFDLPIFNHNQGQIANTRATRLLLHEQYRARLDSAVGNIRGLVTQARRLSADLVQARQAAVSARSLANTARAAYTQGNLDQRTLSDFEKTELQRQLAVVTLERSLGEVQVALTVELGSGLPNTRIAPLDTTASR